MFLALKRRFGFYAFMCWFWQLDDVDSWYPHSGLEEGTPPEEAGDVIGNCYRGDVIRVL